MKRVAALLSLCLCLSSARAVELLRWERVPLTVSLSVDQERVIFVDRPVRVGMPALLGEQLRVQSAGGALYLRASAPFEATRVQLQDTVTGALILLDVSAHMATADQAPLEPVRILEPGAPPSTANVPDEPAHGARESEGATAKRATPVPVVLTRYAAQSLYAPLRTVEAIAGITRAPLRRDLDLETLLPTVSVRAHALVAWRLEDYWLTAIELTNVAGRWVDLDPRALQGDFIAATFQHPNVGPAGVPEDTTVLYLVTRGHGLPESLLPAISPVDGSINLRPAPSHSGARDEE